MEDITETSEKNEILEDEDYEETVTKGKKKSKRGGNRRDNKMANLLKYPKDKIFFKRLNLLIKTVSESNQRINFPVVRTSNEPPSLNSNIL